MALFFDRQHLRHDILELMKQVEDIARIAQKFMADRGDADDLLSVKETLSIHTQIKVRLLSEMDMEDKERQGVGMEAWRSLLELLRNMENLESLRQRIEASVDETALRQQEKAATSEGDGSQADLPTWTIKPQLVTFQFAVK